ncbi:hypothetical protein HDR61_03630 [bacterium]|nr:hypothetical protein [bacterium]
MKKFKYTSLTHLLRHDTWLTLPRLQYILENFNVSPDLGGLPPELCGRIAPQDRADVTAAFHLNIAEFISENRRELLSHKTVFSMQWNGLSALFGTPCVVECRNRAPDPDSEPWRGAIATVCRISFPEIGASYALKVFRMDKYNAAHGPWYEIPAAFAAYRAECKDNNPLYMASLGSVKYMLSSWAGEEKDVGNAVRENRYEIFTTLGPEMHGGNWRGGRRIDYGRTYRTLYGAASYRARKLYRKMEDAAANPEQLASLVENASTQFGKADIDAAMHLAHVNPSSQLRDVLVKLDTYTR